jgi:hypothetical protein
MNNQNILEKRIEDLEEIVKQLLYQNNLLNDRFDNEFQFMRKLKTLYEMNNNQESLPSTICDDDELDGLLIETQIEEPIVVEPEELIDAKYLKMTINQLRKICDEKDISYDIHNDKEYLIGEILEEPIVEETKIEEDGQIEELETQIEETETKIEEILDTKIEEDGQIEEFATQMEEEVGETQIEEFATQMEEEVGETQIEELATQIEELNINSNSTLLLNNDILFQKSKLCQEIIGTDLLLLLSDDEDEDEEQPIPVIIIPNEKKEEITTTPAIMIPEEENIPTTPITEEVINYKKMKVIELKKLCKKRGFKGYSKFRKHQLIELLN